MLLLGKSYMGTRDAWPRKKQSTIKVQGGMPISPKSVYPMVYPQNCDLASKFGQVAPSSDLNLAPLKALGLVLIYILYPNLPISQNSEQSYFLA